MSLIAETPRPPYFAVIFTSHRTDGDHGYGEMSDKTNPAALVHRIHEIKS
ncbi:MAG: hypothetical protein PF501_17690 [Salinisphaera sp.]|jgi:hypothetical protein|nr:hypothetical protein [Salinisphaera sp.]